MSKGRMKTIAALLFLFGAGSLPAAVEYRPQFNDPPVSEAHMEKIRAALPRVPIVEPKQLRRILVVSATAGFRHQSIPTGKFALEAMGASTGAYELVISDDPANFEKDRLAEFDAVVLLNTTQDFFMPNPKKKPEYSAGDWKRLQARHNRLMDNLVAFVRKGGGLVGIHAATDSCYGHEAYGETIGGYFWGHPWRKDDRVVIVNEDPEHALNKPAFGEVKDFELIEEIYQFKPEPYSRERLRILLHLDPERSAPVEGKRRADNDYAVAWVQQVGEGRVFYTSLGHNHHIYWNPMLLRHYLAGIQFACGDLEADTTPSAKILMPNLSTRSVMPCCSGH